MDDDGPGGRLRNRLSGKLQRTASYFVAGSCHDVMPVRAPSSVENWTRARLAHLARADGLLLEQVGRYSWYGCQPREPCLAMLYSPGRLAARRVSLDCELERVQGQPTKDWPTF